MTTKEKKYKFLEVFEKYLGNISQSCKVIGIDRKTYYNWINKDNNFKNKVNEILEAQIDLVESKLIEKIQNNDLGAIIFYLKTKGKNRGYSEKYELEKKDVKEFSNKEQIKIYLPKKE